MKAYSEDLREPVIKTVEAGRPREEVAARFEVSVPSIERWLRLKRETGGLARRPVPGPVALPGRLAEHADATLADHCAWWHGVSGRAVSTATMSRTLTRLGWPRKKTRTANST
jgi:transposase